MSADLFNDLPFNLACEKIDNSTTAEGEARVRALAESEARKAQTEFEQMKREGKPYLLSKDGKTVYKISL